MINNTIAGIAFNPDGSFSQVGGGSSTISFTVNGLPTPQTVNLNFGSPNGFNGLTQFGGSSSATASSQDGYAAGTLSSVSISQDGTINGLFTNGQIYAAGAVGRRSVHQSGGSGSRGTELLPTDGQFRHAGHHRRPGWRRGSVQAERLESSNVDVSTEFTQFITGQQAYEVNARLDFHQQSSDPGSDEHHPLIRVDGKASFSVY